jgi:hypothetical protein
MNTNKPVLVLGASDNPARYSYLAVHRLRNKGYPVFAIGKRFTLVADVPVETEKKNFQNIHTVTLYLNPAHQQEYYNYLLSLKPKRIIFNPGAENEELYQLAEQNGIQPLEACTLVLLSTGQF